MQIEIKTMAKSTGYRGTGKSHAGILWKDARGAEVRRISDSGKLDKSAG